MNPIALALTELIEVVQDRQAQQLAERAALLADLHALNRLMAHTHPAQCTDLAQARWLIDQTLVTLNARVQQTTGLLGALQTVAWTYVPETQAVLP